MPPILTPSQILLVEDNPADVELVREALREHNVHCELRVLSDGKAVIDFINNLDADMSVSCPDLLLLDLALPKFDGRIVLKYLRASERCGHIPVIILTSSDLIVDREIAEKNAALHYFQKPASQDQFMRLGGIVKAVIAGNGAAS
jgi:CheY-like chemotaxis protein